MKRFPSPLSFFRSRSFSQARTTASPHRLAFSKKERRLDRERGEDSSSSTREEMIIVRSPMKREGSAGGVKSSPQENVPGARPLSVRCSRNSTTRSSFPARRAINSPTRNYRRRSYRRLRHVARENRRCGASGIIIDDGLAESVGGDDEFGGT